MRVDPRAHARSLAHDLEVLLDLRHDPLPEARWSDVGGRREHAGHGGHLSQRVGAARRTSSDRARAYTSARPRQGCRAGREGDHVSIRHYRLFRRIAKVPRGQSAPHFGVRGQAVGVASASPRYGSLFRLCGCRRLESSPSHEVDRHPDQIGEVGSQYAFGQRRHGLSLPGALCADPLHSSLRLARGPPLLGKQLGRCSRRPDNHFICGAPKVL